MRTLILASKVSIIVWMIWSLTACCQPKLLGDYKQDSVRVEVVENIVYVHDTLIYEVPLIKEVQTVRDTISHLTNKYADSWASVGSDGTLSHTLLTRPQRIAIPYERTEKHRDSIVYRTTEKQVMVEVERNLSWWEQTQIRGFWAILSILTIIFLWKWIKRKISLL
ncbi:MAG: hypothetical protein J6B41_07390 [Alistipes sp.]|nr:hypothetical protein [Alistipes sp.]